MAADPPTAINAIIRNRRWDNYASLKQHFKEAMIKEVLYSGHQTSTAAYAELDGTSETIAFLGANDQVYARSEADLAALDGDSIYLDYCNKEGDLYEGVETLLNIADGLGTDHEMPIGNENLLDTVDGAPDGAAVTLTTLTATENEWAGKYLVVYSGDQEGVNSLIVSNTAGEGGVVVTTLKDNWNANMAADLVSIQSAPYDDVYRIRRIWCETEAPADNTLYICDKDKTNVYGVIQDNATYGPTCSRYFAPSAATCRSFLGRIQMKAAYLLEADATPGGYYVKITFTPKAESEEAAGADVSLEFSFSEVFDWEPCIELEPATDVIVYIKKLVDADHVAVHADLTYLEAYPTLQRFEAKV